MGFRSVNIKPGEIRKITISPTITFRPEHLIIPWEVAQNFSILDLLIDDVSQWRHYYRDRIPAIYFSSPDYFISNGIITELAGKNSIITLIAVNESKKKTSLYGSISGMSKS